MSQEEQNAVVDETRRALCADKQHLACLRMKGDQYAERLCNVAAAIKSTDGSAESERELKQIPTLGDLLNLNSQIRATKGQIAQRAKRLKKHDKARRR